MNIFIVGLGIVICFLLVWVSYALYQIGRTLVEIHRYLKSIDTVLGMKIWK